MRTAWSADDGFRRGQRARGDRKKKGCDFQFYRRSGGLGRFWKILVIEANDLGLQKRPFSPFFLRSGAARLS